MILSSQLWGRFASPPTKENTPGRYIKDEFWSHRQHTVESFHTSHIASKPLQITYLCITGASSADGSQWDKVPSFANKPVNIEKNSTSETFSSQFPWRHVAHCAWVLLETLFKSPLHCFSTTCILWIFRSTACLRQTWHTDGIPWNTQLGAGALSHLSLSKVTRPSYHAWFGGSHLACETSPVFTVC